MFITYQRRANSKGYFSADRFSGRGARLGRHELALNPDTFIDRCDEQICLTLVHEQCHAVQKRKRTSFGQLPQQGVARDHKDGRTAAIIDRRRRWQGDRTSRHPLHHPRRSVHQGLRRAGGNGLEAEPAVGAPSGKSGGTNNSRPSSPAVAGRMRGASLISQSDANSATAR